MRRIVGIPCGRWTKWAVLAAWVVVLIVAGPLAGKLKGAEKNDASASLPKNAESTRVVDLAKRFTPSDAVPAVVVYERDGAVSAADQAKVAADVRRFAGIDNTGGPAVGPVLAKDGAALQVIVPIKAGNKGSEAIDPAVKQIRAIVRDGNSGSGLRAYVTGPAGYSTAFSDALMGIDSNLVYITAAIVIVILLLTYRSPVLWLLPVVCVVIALTAAPAVIYLLARHAGLVVNDLSAFILTLLVVFGRWVFWPVRPTLGSPEPTERGVWARMGAAIARRPRMVWLVTAVTLGAMALGVTGLDADNLLQNKDLFRGKPEAVTGEQALGRHFPAGSGDPVQVIGRSTAAPRLRAAVADTPGV